MVMGLGVGAWTAAVFHLFTHAFFKADLFLGAGSISHSGSHHSFDMKKDMGGLRKYMPVTFWTFVIGSVALAGIFPLAGFWSKDEILVTASQSNYQFFFWVGLIGAFMTAAYMTRCIYLTFFGEYRGGHADALTAGETLEDEHVAEAIVAAGAHHAGGHDAHATPDAGAHAGGHDAHHGDPHESNGLITIPLVILSAFAIFAGFLNAAPFHIEKFREWFEPRVAFPVDTIVHASFSWPKAILSVAIALAGFGVAYAYYWLQWGPQRLAERNNLARAGKTFLVKKYYLDDLYEKVIVAGIKGPIAAGVYWFNQNVIDNVLNYTGRGAKALGQVTYDYIDQRVVDGAVNGLAVETGEAGEAARQLQTGRLQFYALMLVLAVGLFSLALWIAS
jgi:NADH-quinone oxidoreductase subunit L